MSDIRPNEQYVHSSGDFVSIEQLVPVLPHLSYQLFFDKKTPEAIAELSKDIRRTIRATLLASDISSPPPGFLTSKDTFLGTWSEVTEVRYRSKTYSSIFNCSSDTACAILHIGGRGLHGGAVQHPRLRE
jgi:hypothetical protein